ncbi:MAG: efflux transporter outer membrane subunit [Bacteroidetes bacterium]|nr:efflux transporter outer membrane subunit [Bacteroidota bacterium]
MNKIVYKFLAIGCIAIVVQACIPLAVQRPANTNIPASYNGSLDTVNTAKIKWDEFFTDANLRALIDTALMNNQELNIILQEINIANNEVRSRKGAYLPFIDVYGGASVEKTARHTRFGAVDDNSSTLIAPQTQIPTHLTDYLLSANLSWQVDIWKQLRTARKSAIYRYLSTIEGKNFMVTNLVAEIAYSYFELMALDNQLAILKQNIQIQQNALKIVTLQKRAGMVTELAVRRYQAEVRKNQSRQYYIQQSIIEAQNRINFLVGRYPKNVERNSWTFVDLTPEMMKAGIPSQMLRNRPDVRQAEMQLAAAELDVKVARFNFYPVLNITAGSGFEAFNTKYLISSPESMFYNAAGGLLTPFVNRNAIKATYLSANAMQVQAAFNYEKTVLNAYTEIVNQIAKINNLANSYNLKKEQVQALARSVDISINLFKSARADYFEVLLVQRDALESKMELIETKKHQMNAMVKMYQVLGGGWN